MPRPEALKPGDERRRGHRHYRLWRGTAFSIGFHAVALIVALVTIPSLPVIFYEEVDLPSPATLLVELISPDRLPQDRPRETGDRVPGQPAEPRMSPSATDSGANIPSPPLPPGQTEAEARRPEERESPSPRPPAETLPAPETPSTQAKKPAIRPSKKNLERLDGNLSAREKADGVDPSGLQKSGATPPAGSGSSTFSAFGDVLREIEQLVDRPPTPEQAAAARLGADNKQVSRLRAAAKKGYGFAQFNLAQRLWYGLGLPKDRKQAAVWLRRAADHGYGPAQLLLGLRATRGDAGKVDLGEADFWWSAAEKRGFSAAERARKLLKHRMQPEDIIKARSLRRHLGTMVVPLVELTDAEQQPTTLDGMLRIAAERGDFDNILRLLHAGANPEAPDQAGRTALINAAWRGRKSAVTLLVDLGTDPGVMDKARRTPLMWSAINGHASVARVMADAGADTDRRDADELTPLMRAAWNGHAEVVRILLAAGADPNARDPSGRTAKDYARLSGNPSIIALLP